MTGDEKSCQIAFPADYSEVFATCSAWTPVWMAMELMVFRGFYGMAIINFYQLLSIWILCCLTNSFLMFSWRLRSRTSASGTPWRARRDPVAERGYFSRRVVFRWSDGRRVRSCCESKCPTWSATVWTSWGALFVSLALKSGVGKNQSWMEPTETALHWMSRYLPSNRRPQRVRWRFWHALKGSLLNTERSDNNSSNKTQWTCDEGDFPCRFLPVPPGMGNPSSPVGPMARSGPSCRRVASCCMQLGWRGPRHHLLGVEPHPFRLFLMLKKRLKLLSFTFLENFKVLILA